MPKHHVLEIDHLLPQCCVATEIKINSTELVVCYFYNSPDGSPYLYTLEDFRMILSLGTRRKTVKYFFRRSEVFCTKTFGKLSKLTTGLPVVRSWISWIYHAYSKPSLFVHGRKTLNVALQQNIPPLCEKTTLLPICMICQHQFLFA